jgi:hypothetical protein
MPNAIYSGTGEYDSATLMAVYSAYLPKPDEGAVYEFRTGTIYNISCKAYPNRILIFMRVKDGANTDLSKLTLDGNTSDTPTTIMFSLDSGFIEDVNDNCEKLELDKDIELILFHDQYYDISYVEKNLFCLPASAYATGPAPDGGAKTELESPLAIVPKKGKPGLLLVKKLKP